MPFAVQRVQDIRCVEGTLVTIEDRIAGRALSEMLPGQEGERRRTALAAHGAVAEAMAVVRVEGEFGDLLVPDPVRRAH
jgi:hypothetical protein